MNKTYNIITSKSNNIDKSQDNNNNFKLWNLKLKKKMIEPK